MKPVPTTTLADDLATALLRLVCCNHPWECWQSYSENHLLSGTRCAWGCRIHIPCRIKKLATHYGLLFFLCREFIIYKRLLLVLWRNSVLAFLSNTLSLERTSLVNLVPVDFTVQLCWSHWWPWSWFQRPQAEQGSDRDGRGSVSESATQEIQVKYFSEVFLRCENTSNGNSALLQRGLVYLIVAWFYNKKFLPILSNIISVISNLWQICMNVMMDFIWYKNIS